MPLRYAAGEEIREGDRVLYEDLPAQIEFVADPAVRGVHDWYVQEFGGGVMLAEPSVFCSLFLELNHIDESLVFVSRKGE